MLHQGRSLLLSSFLRGSKLRPSLKKILTSRIFFQISDANLFCLFKRLLTITRPGEEQIIKIYFLTALGFY